MHRFHRLYPNRNWIFLWIAALLTALGLTLVFLSQTAFAQTTYVITDGSRVLVHTTSASDTKAVLGEAGLELGADDTYTTGTEDGTAAIQIQRGQSICINYYGEQMEVASRGETVQQLLTRLNLSWDDSDALSAPLDAMTYDGMELTIAQVMHLEQTYSAVIHHETVRCSDMNLPQDTERVLTGGRDGEMLCTAVVTYVNGVETDRTVLTQQVTIQPVDEIIAVGTGAGRQQEGEASSLPIITESTITLPTGEVLTYDGVLISLSTAYCDKGLTATGTQARVGAIAVDPSVIPYGTRMFIMSLDGEYVYGIATAEDCGSKEHIYGTRTDLHFDTYAECRQFGARECVIFFLS